MANFLPIVSVIVPVYNGEEYLSLCLNSILAQSFVNIEIIIIDDCSTDRTRTIIDSFVAKDRRCRAIYKDVNQGAGACRNDAIQIARGKFLSFVDSDDIVHPQMLKIAYGVAELTSSDIVEFGYSCLKCANEEFLEVDENIVAYDLFVQREIAENIDRFDDITCNKLIRSNTVSENNIRYKGRIYEDTYFSKKSLLCARKVAKIHQKLYFYITRGTSTVNTFSLEKLEILFLRNSEIEGLYAQYAVPRKIQNVIKHRSACFILNNLLALSDSQFPGLKDRFSGGIVLPSFLRYIRNIMKFCDSWQLVRVLLQVQLVYFKLRGKINKMRR